MRQRLSLARRPEGIYKLAMIPFTASPQLALTYHENGLHARGPIADVFSNAMRNGQVRSMDARFLAEQFLYAVVDGPVRAIVLSGKIAKADKDQHERVTAAVGLFLDGCLARPARRS